MKPTKEQLADPKWWDENSDGFDFLYECESTGEIVFANREGKDANGLRLRLELDIWKLLAKRPEPEWVPEVGEWFTASGGAQIAFIGIDSGNAYVCEIKGGGLTRLYDFDGCKPIKTQREELIDIILMNSEAELDAAAATASIILGKYDLTEKDGE